MIKTPIYNKFIVNKIEDEKLWSIILWLSGRWDQMALKIHNKNERRNHIYNVLDLLFYVMGCVFN